MKEMRESVMRIRFGTWIQGCYFVSHPGGDVNALNAATNNGMYEIQFDSVEEAKAAYDQLLEKGYYDATNNQYSNWSV